MSYRDIQKKGFHERFHVDSHGRRWNFTQVGRMLPGFRAASGQFNKDQLFWVCTECGGRENVKFEHFVHDEVTVPDPTDQLDAHDCDVERVRQVMES